MAILHTGRGPKRQLGRSHILGRLRPMQHELLFGAVQLHRRASMFLRRRSTYSPKSFGLCLGVERRKERRSLAAEARGPQSARPVASAITLTPWLITKCAVKTYRAGAGQKRPAAIDIRTTRAFGHGVLRIVSSPITFGNQTISGANGIKVPSREEIHGFASLPRGRFALIVCNRYDERSRLLYS